MPATTRPEAPDAAWAALAEASDNVFSTRPWVEAWWEHYGEGEAMLVHEDGLVLPVHVTGRLVRQLRFMGSEQSDQLGPVCVPADRALAVEPLRRLAREQRVDVLLLQDVPADDDWWRPLGGQRIRLTASPVSLLPGDWEAYLAAQSKNMRSQLRKKPRRVEDAFDVRYRLSDASTLRADIDRLLELHEDRWEGQTPLVADRFQAFLHDAAARLLVAGWLRLWNLELDGVTRAAQFDVRFGTHQGCYQLGRDPAYEEHSLGFVLMAHCVEQAIASGASEYRYLRGNESYKYRFADHSGDVESIAVPFTLKGRAAIRAAALRREPDESPAQTLPPRPTPATRTA